MALLGMAAGGWLLLTGCQGEPAGNAGKAPPQAPESTAGRTTVEGPVEATVSLQPSAPRLGDPLTLTLEVESEPGVLVEMPAFGEALGRFSIVDFTPRRQTRPDGGLVNGQRYTLLAPMSGRQRIPPLRIEFLDQRPGQPATDEYRELLTEELTVDIESVLPQGQITDELRPARPALRELRAGRRLRFLALAGTAVVVAGALLWAVLLWRRRARVRARITAYDKAMRRLQALERRGLPAADEADAWYVEISDIVRHYLEDRYGLRAPELTTQEFLMEARRSADLSTAHRDLLTSFLEKCDRVKFAAYHPERSESRTTLEAARRFLDETRLLAEDNETPAAAA